MPTAALLDNLSVIVALVVAFASLAVSLTTATMTRRHERQLEQARDEQTRRQVEHERLTRLYGDVHKAGNELVVGLRIQESMRIPRLLRVPLGLRWLKQGSPVRDIGHRRAMLELHGAPQQVLEAWEHVDAATVKLHDAQMARENVEEAATNVRSNLDVFVAAARDHLAEVWPPAHAHQPLGPHATPGVDTPYESVAPEPRNAPYTDRGTTQSWTIASSTAAAALLLNRLGPSQAPDALTILLSISGAGLGWHLGVAAGAEGGLRDLWTESRSRQRRTMLAVMAGFAMAAAAVAWMGGGPGTAIFVVFSLAIMVAMMWYPDLAETPQLKRRARRMTRASVQALVAVLVATALINEAQYRSAIYFAVAAFLVAGVAGWSKSRLKSVRGRA